MARFRITASVKEAWLDSDKLVVLVGSENAASLAASTPTGGTFVKTSTVAAAKLPSDPTTVRLEYDYTPTDKCASLPVGLASCDPQGNTSTPDESILQLRDPPRGVPRPTAAATESANEAQLTWTLSPDIN